MSASQVLQWMYNSLVHSREFNTFALIVAFVLWVVGIVYCDKVAFEKGYNVWLARLIGVFIPYLGPLYYWWRKNKRRRRRRRRRYIYPSASWSSLYAARNTEIGPSPVAPPTTGEEKPAERRATP
ncbi:MAG: hypothetical protein ABIK62_03710 [candidate division WOR-3 bacterium]